MESLCKIKLTLVYINLSYHYQELRITEPSLHMQDHPKYSQNFFFCYLSFKITSTT